MWWTKCAYNHFIFAISLFQVQKKIHCFVKYVDYLEIEDFTGKDVVLLKLCRQISSIFQLFETFGFGFSVRQKAEAFLHLQLRLWPKAKKPPSLDPWAPSVTMQRTFIYKPKPSLQLSVIIELRSHKSRKTEILFDWVISFAICISNGSYFLSKRSHRSFIKHKTKKIWFCIIVQDSKRFTNNPRDRADDLSEEEEIPKTTWSRLPCCYIYLSTCNR